MCPSSNHCAAALHSVGSESHCTVYTRIPVGKPTRLGSNV